MKKVIHLLLIVIAFSCNKKETKLEVHETKSLIDPKNPLNKLKYANKIDFYCKMDITKYGVSDTVTYNRNLYGFCSSMCKQEFLMKPEEYLDQNKN